MNGHPFLDAAIRVAFPPQHVRVIASRAEGSDAYVLFDTGSPQQPYLYGVCFEQRDGLWYEGTSGNGGGWSSTGDSQSNLGTWALWGDAARGTDMVSAEINGVVSDHPVVNGVYLAVWFRRPFEPKPRIVDVGRKTRR